MFKTEVKGRRLVLTLDRAPVNAINDAWLEGFHEILTDLEGREDVSLLHIRSAQRVFCAGMDVDRIRSLTTRSDGAAAMVADVRQFQRAFARVEQLPLLVLVEIGGAALGGGLELALAADLRIASKRAKLGLPEAKLGLIPGAGGTQRLTRLCGRGTAARLILAGEVVDGLTAERLGIVQWAVDHESLSGEAEALAARIDSLSLGSTREAKRLIAAALDPARDGYAEELEADRRLFDTEDTRERLAQFLAGAR